MKQPFFWVLFLLVASSRFFFLPNGPWEQDEALMACGVLDFDPGHHMPHPPGFPLWILLGRVVRGLGIADPLRALQIASAVFSTLTLAVLVRLWGAWLPHELALAGAALSLFFPGVWFHAARGFSETPAAMIFLLALLVWQRTDGKGLTKTAILLTAAALLRPPLVPFLAVVGLVWALRHRKTPKVILGAGLWSCLLGVGTLVPLIIEAGGLKSYWAAFGNHLHEHTFLLGSEGLAWGQLGVVRGLGGSLPAIFVVFLALIGWGSFAPRLGGRRFVVSSALGAWLVYLLVFTHNSSYPRYWVLVLLMLGPLAVQGLSVLGISAKVAAALGVMGAGGFALWTMPAVRYVHNFQLPPVAAFSHIQREFGTNVVFQDELFSFRNYLVRAGKVSYATLRWSEVRAPKFALGGSKLYLVSETEPTVFPSSISHEWTFAVEEPRVVFLSQGRFLRATVVRNPVVLFSGGSIREGDDTGNPFVWLYRDATLLFPAMEGGGTITFAVELPPGLKENDVEVWLEGTRVLGTTIIENRALLSVPVPPLGARWAQAAVVPLRLAAKWEQRLLGDFRPLAMRVRMVSVEVPPWGQRGYSFIPSLESMHQVAVTAEGLYGIENFAGVPGAWCQPQCTFTLPVSRGLLRLWVAAPRLGGARAVFAADDVKVYVNVPPQGTFVAIPLGENQPFAHRMRLQIQSDAFAPPRDPRELGVVILGADFEPEFPALNVAGKKAVAFPFIR